MSARGEAIEAAIREFVKPRMHTNESHGKLRADLGAAIEAALAVLHPTVPNTVEALDALPIGTVLRSGEYLARRMRPGYWAYTDGFMVTTRLTYALAPTVTEWTVIYQPEENR